MTCRRTSTVDHLPDDPVGEAAADAVAEVLSGTSVELRYAPAGTGDAEPSPNGMAATATGRGPDGWDVTVAVRLDDRVARLIPPESSSPIRELLDALPTAALRASEPFRPATAAPVRPAFRRAMRDAVAAELLTGFLRARVEDGVNEALVDETLVDETIQYLIELSGTRVEAHDLTHGVVVTGVLHDEPRLSFRYPRDVRAAKRAPLLFDGQRSVLLVDPRGRARTEVQRHRFERFAPGALRPQSGNGSLAPGALVSETTRVLGGVGFYVRADRSIWTYADGQPLLVRRGEHWTAYPLELTASIANMIGGGDIAGVVARAAFIISAQTAGAILAIVDDPARLDGVVSPKDRYDLRNEFDPTAMQVETRLHHLIDTEQLDEHTLARLATLDGATVLDRQGRLLAYGAVVSTSDSQHEGARTSAARTLSEIAEVVLKVSVDGEITIFREGAAVTTLLGRAWERSG